MAGGPRVHRGRGTSAGRGTGGGERPGRVPWPRAARHGADPFGVPRTRLPGASLQLPDRQLASAPNRSPEGRRYIGHAVNVGTHSLGPGLEALRIPAGNRLTTCSTTRSAFPSVVPDLAGLRCESEKTALVWRESKQLFLDTDQGRHGAGQLDCDWKPVRPGCGGRFGRCRACPPRESPARGSVTGPPALHDRLPGRDLLDNLATRFNLRPVQKTGTGTLQTNVVGRSEIHPSAKERI